MREETDLLDELENEGNDTLLTKSTPTAKQNNSGENLYEKNDWEAMKLPMMDMSEERSFMVILNLRNGREIPEAREEKILKAARLLINNGFKFRHTGDENNTIHNKILKMENVKYETYLPWKKMNPSISDPIVKRSAENYKIACLYHNTMFKNVKRKFNELSPGHRAYLASIVTSIFGIDCKTKPTLVIADSECGNEGKPSGRVDFDASGELFNYFRYIDDAEIPMFNFKNDDSVKRLIEYVKPMITKKEEKKEEPVTTEENDIDSIDF